MPSSRINAGTRPNGLIRLTWPKFLNTDEGSRSNGLPSTLIETATRRTNGESNCPKRRM